MPNLVNPEYFRMTDEERAIMELSAWNFFSSYGRKMMIPVELFEALKSAGVDMRNMEANPNLVGASPPANY